MLQPNIKLKADFLIQFPYSQSIRAAHLQYTHVKDIKHSSPNAMLYKEQQSMSFFVITPSKPRSLHLRKYPSNVEFFPSTCQRQS